MAVYVTSAVLLYYSQLPVVAILGLLIGMAYEKIKEGERVYAFTLLCTAELVLCWLGGWYLTILANSKCLAI